MDDKLDLFCAKCKVQIFWDDTESVWACDCTQVVPVPDEDGIPSLENKPPFWEELE